MQHECGAGLCVDAGAIDCRQVWSSLEAAPYQLGHGTRGSQQGGMTARQQQGQRRGNGLQEGREVLSKPLRVGQQLQVGS